MPRYYGRSTSNGNARVYKEERLSSSEYIGGDWDFSGLEDLMSSAQGDCHGDCDVYDSYDDYY